MLLIYSYSPEQLCRVARISCVVNNTVTHQTKTQADYWNTESALKFDNENLPIVSI